MQQQKMEELSVSELMQRYNLIIPEIQREYVWGNNDDVINTFILDIENGYQKDKETYNNYLGKLKVDINNGCSPVSLITSQSFFLLTIYSLSLLSLFIVLITGINLPL